MSRKPWRSQRLLVGLRLLRNLRIDERHTLLLWAAVCGVLGALAALGFKELTAWVLFLFTGSHEGFVDAFSSIPPWQRLVVPIVGALICGLILQFGTARVKSQNTDYMEAVTLGDGVVGFRSSIIRSLAAMFAIAGGESIGREGPLVQIAALVSSLWGRLRHLPPARMRMMVACGAAAGLAGVYHSPLGGAFFVAEVVIGSIAMETLGPLLIASTVSALTVQTLEGFDPIYLFPQFSQSGPADIGAYAIAGIAMGLASFVWIRLLSGSKTAFKRLHLPLWARLTLGGLLIGLIAMRHPEICGNGKSLIQGILADQYTVTAIAILLGLKVAATCISFGSGAIGGVFTPSLLVGSVLGFLFGALLNLAHFSIVPAEMALISMGAFLAAATNAPAMSILMIFEMSMQYQVVLPLMVSTVIAYATARSLSRRGLYSHSLMHGARGVLDRPLGQITIADMMRTQPHYVESDASFPVIAGAFLREPRQEIWVHAPFGFMGSIRLEEVGPFLRDSASAETVLAMDIVDESTPRLAPETTIAEAFKVFAGTSLTRLPVLDADGVLIGEVPRSDIFLTISEIARRG
ncbi:MAG: chloride channel protein CIC family [Puniceicoccaceae bacterium 5H]|nr:MAG: chloride channel protein CIC family [Puniceicoccaceae bacterium 5H]